MKKILITGAAGFLGSHLCDRFIKEGYEVIGMDNLITGSLKNIEHLFPLKEFSFYHHDVSKFIHVPGHLDYILHFASPASPIDYLKIPIQTLKVGSLGTHNCLGLALNKKARILVASTSEVYGDPLVHPQNEDYWGNVNPVGPRGVYDEAKRFQEAMTMAYHTYHGVETRIIRIFNTYGPRMRLNDGRALPAFIGQALRGEDLTVFGDGSQTRSFCYVSDLVEGIYRLLMSDYVGIVRNNDRLQRANRRLDLLHEETEALFKKTVVSPQLCELRNMITVAYLIVKSAAFRHESRGLHFNTDYPNKSELVENIVL